jgi:hypothetical protein
MLGLSPPPGSDAAGRQEMQTRNINRNFIVWKIVVRIPAEAIRNSLFLQRPRPSPSGKGF